MKICGNIENVPANVVNTVSVLPRLSKEAGIIKLQLKRKLIKNTKSYIITECQAKKSVKTREDHIEQKLDEDGGGSYF